MADLLRALHAREPLVTDEALIDEGLGFSVDLRPAKGDLVGYRARPHSGVIDLDWIGAYAARDFWDELRTTDGQLISTDGKPKLDTDTDMYRFEDSEGRDQQIQKSSVKQILER